MPTERCSSISQSAAASQSPPRWSYPLILFTVAFKEGFGVLNNTPVTFYRCDGQGPSCCKNGPHNLGFAEKFTYLSDGKGFETRQKDSMRRHLLVSRKCRELKPIVIYPKEEGWKLW